MQTALPQPAPGEIQVDYYSRVFPLLDGDTDEKNAAILAAWDESEEAARLDTAAAKKFPAERFSRATRIPVFTEHETVRRKLDASGNVVEEPVKWDRNKLAAMCYQMNHRVLDTGSFSPITEGHTPDKNARDKGCPQPPVLGYQGKFRLGLIGNLNPKWTIFCDEYRHIEDADKFQRLTRRSPEVWTAAEQPFFDPCAALGAETPRLDMGTSLSYSREGFWQSVGKDGSEIDKYSMGAPTFAGGGNTFAPKMDSYEAGEAHEDADQDADMMTSVIEAVAQMLQPIMETIEQMKTVLPSMQKQALRQELPPKMETGAAPPAAGIAAPTAEGGAASPPAAPVEKPAEPNPQPSQPAASSPSPTPPPQDIGDDDKAMMGKYMAGQCSETDMRAHRDRKRQPAAPAPYSKLSATEQQARYERLNSLRDKGYEFELEGELKLTASYSPEQFSMHCDRVVTRYSRLPIGAAPLPTLEDDPTPTTGRTFDKLTMDEVKHVAKYAMEHGISNVREAYQAMHAAEVSTTSPVN